MNSSRIRAVFFDLDGTLIETAQGLEHAFRNLGLINRPFDAVACFLSGVDWRALIDYLFRNQPDRIDSIRTQFSQYYDAHIAEFSEFYPQGREIIAALRAQGTLVGIISNKQHELCLELDKKLNFHVDFLLGSGHIAFKKPHPAPLLYACKSCNLYPAECLYIGDMPSDLEAAKWAGMTGVYARYGLHHHFNTQFNPKVSINALEEILALVKPS